MLSPEAIRDGGGTKAMLRGLHKSLSYTLDGQYGGHARLRTTAAVLGVQAAMKS